jgi:hypothetical protein
MPKIWKEWFNDDGTPYYQNKNTGETHWTVPKQGWIQKKSRSTGKNYYANAAGKLPSQFEVPVNTSEPLVTAIGVGASTGEHFPSRKGSNASTVSAASSTTMASNAEAQRIRNLEAQVEALKRQLATTSVACAPTAAPAANNAYSKYRKMLKMGIPRPAVNQKMRANGLDPAVLNGAMPTATVAPRPGGPPAFLAGLGGVTLKKTTGPAAAPVANNKKPVTGAQAVQQGLAAAAAAKRAEMGSVNIEARLAAAKATKKNTGAPTGFAKFQAELAAKAAAKAAAKEAAAKPKHATSNAQGPLPPGWYYMNDGTDQWYASNSGLTQWERPEGLKRKSSWSWNGGRRKTRRNRSSRRRRN